MLYHIHGENGTSESIPFSFRTQGQWDRLSCPAGLRTVIIKVGSCCFQSSADDSTMLAFLCYCGCSVDCPLIQTYMQLLDPFSSLHLQFVLLVPPSRQEADNVFFHLVHHRQHCFRWSSSSAMEGRQGEIWLRRSDILTHPYLFF